MCTFLATPQLFFQTGNCLLCTRRDHRPLRRTFFRFRPFAFLHDPGVQPFSESAVAFGCRLRAGRSPSSICRDYPIKGLYDTLPISRTFLRESRLSVPVIRSKENHSPFLGPSIDTADCISC